MNVRYTRVSARTTAALGGTPCVVVTGSPLGDVALAREFVQPTALLGDMGTDGRVAVSFHSAPDDATRQALAAACGYVVGRSAPVGHVTLVVGDVAYEVAIDRDGDFVSGVRVDGVDVPCVVVGRGRLAW